MKRKHSLYLPTGVSSDIRSAGWRTTRKLGRHIDSAATGLAKWSTSDHYGFASAMIHRPRMGFLELFEYIVVHLVATIIGAAVSAILIGLLIMYGIPFLLTL